MNENDVKDLLAIINDATIKGLQAERILELKKKVISLLQKEKASEEALS